MEILNKTISIATALVICSSLSFAGWKSSADGMVAVQTSSPTSLNTSLTTSYAGGSARVNWNSLGNVNIINATAPKASIGCNGVEIGFGSISFLDFDSLVSKLKMIASQAPAFAFKMAIDTACSQCSTIMQDLEGAVEAINSFSLDSCAIAENIGNSIGGPLGDMANPSSSRYSDTYAAQKKLNEDKSSFKTDTLKDTINSWNDSINGKSLKLEQFKGYGSYLNNLRINKIPLLNGYDPKQFINLLRGMVGDVVGYMNTANDKEDVYAEIEGSGNINDLINLFSGTTPKGTFVSISVELIGNSGDWSDVSLTNMPTGSNAKPILTDVNIDDTVETGSTETRSWTYNIKSSITTVVDKIKNKSELTNDDLVYLQNLPYNGYKIVNHFASVGASSTSLTIDDYAKYVALENIRSQFTLILNLAEHALSEYSNNLNREASAQNKLSLPKYAKILANVRAQKKALAENKIFEQIPKLKEKIKAIMTVDIPKNRTEKVQ